MTSDPYFYSRAEQELLMAERAHDSRVVRAHYELANRYLDLFYLRDLSADRLAALPLPRE